MAIIHEYNALLLCRQEPDGAKAGSALPPESSSEEQEPVLTPQIPPPICYLPQHLLQPGSCPAIPSEKWHSCALLGPTNEGIMFTNSSSCSQTSVLGLPRALLYCTKNYLVEALGQKN